ncbi:hypothetical protein [Terrabacter sp. 2RAF25]|uniref:hypothetical protein n=1 Tax=Terrabacter sp. 2RAF25 TaxID=3232998 RepID=UPI003F9BE1B1
MSQTSRRSFLAVAGAGAAATAVAGPAAAATAASTRAAAPLVAHVPDAATGTVVIYLGDEEVVVHDHDLVRRLNRAAGR